MLKIGKQRHIHLELLIYFLGAQGIVTAIKSNSSKYLTPDLHFSQSFHRAI